MTKHEFEALIGTSINSEDYAFVEYVYTYHPAISNTNGKKEIATIYQLPGGMRIIRDMVGTADRAQEIDQQLGHARSEMEDIKIRINELEAALVALKR